MVQRHYRRMVTLPFVPSNRDMISRHEAQNLLSKISRPWLDTPLATSGATNRPHARHGADHVGTESAVYGQDNPLRRRRRRNQATTISTVRTLPLPGELPLRFQPTYRKHGYIPTTESFTSPGATAARVIRRRRRTTITASPRSALTPNPEPCRSTANRHPCLRAPSSPPLISTAATSSLPTTTPVL
jgi:hypothetical protein